MTNFLDLTSHRPKLETEHNVVPGRPPTKLAAFSFFDNLGGFKLVTHEVMPMRQEVYCKLQSFASNSLIGGYLPRAR